ncbi:unnamed protein product [Ceratitis capitata]|uniref:(Mediterranean fruit fly) hypothetical protein n=1 Tax=Ceratitis capitata TaxID=7213 RepID=A0A811TYU5_CERCA|nr:unnamed protein product [Ceratitis capitata]
MSVVRITAICSYKPVDIGIDHIGNWRRDQITEDDEGSEESVSDYTEQDTQPSKMSSPEAIATAVQRKEQLFNANKDEVNSNSMPSTFSTFTVDIKSINSSGSNSCLEGQENIKIKFFALHLAEA